MGADGTAEEGDNVRADVENVQTGTGNDLIDARVPRGAAAGPLVRRQQRQRLALRRRPRDSLYGDAGNDTLDGRRRGRLPRRRRGARHARGRRRRRQPLPRRRQRHGRRRRRRRLHRRRRTATTGADSLVGRHRLRPPVPRQPQRGPDDRPRQPGRRRRGRARATTSAPTSSASTSAPATTRSTSPPRRRTRPRADNEVYGGGGNDTIKTRSRRGLRRGRHRQRRDHRRRRRGPRLRGRRRRPVPDEGRLLRPRRRRRRRRGQRHRAVRRVRRAAELPVGRAACLTPRPGARWPRAVRIRWRARGILRARGRTRFDVESFVSVLRVEDPGLAS